MRGLALGGSQSSATGTAVGQGQTVEQELDPTEMPFLLRWARVYAYRSHCILMRWPWAGKTPPRSQAGGSPVAGPARMRRNVLAGTARFAQHGYPRSFFLGRAASAPDCLGKAGGQGVRDPIGPAPGHGRSPELLGRPPRDAVGSDWVGLLMQPDTEAALGRQNHLYRPRQPTGDVIIGWTIH